MVFKILKILNNIREPKQILIKQKIINSFMVLALGAVLGILSKVLDDIPSNWLPYFLQTLDLRNFFSRIGIWMFLATVISVYSATTFRAAINVFLFFAAMIATYYSYTIFIIGFYPKSYMMIWIGLTMLSPILAFVCWYAKGKGIFPLIISSFILAVLFGQAFGYGMFLEYLSLDYGLEFLLWVAAIIILYQDLKQGIKMVGLSIVFVIILRCLPVPLLW